MSGENSGKPLGDRGSVSNPSGCWVNSVDTAVFAIVYFALEALTCVRLSAVLADTGLNDVLVHRFVCRHANVCNVCM